MHPVNVAEYEAVARTRLEPGPLDYIAGGSGDEITLRENRAAFNRLQLRPRVLVDVSTVDLRVTVLGRRVTFPVLVAPTAFQMLAHPEGELATARAAARAGTIMVASTMSSYRLEEIAAAADGLQWFQLYCYRDRGVTRALVERAEAAGFVALCLTVDLPRVGPRDRDARHAFWLPPEIQPRNFEGLVQAPPEGDFAEYIGSLVDPSLTWAVVEWLRSVTTLPILLKGILTGEDARLATSHGADGIVVSNHGGRQLDGVPATIEVLSEIVQAVDGKAEVLMDGGIRRGTDVVKALALGARAVLVGRPVLWGLAVDGADGALHVLHLLRGETELAMALLGCPTAGDLTAAHVGRLTA